MKNILELLYDPPANWVDIPHGPDSDFQKATQMKRENLSQLLVCLTAPQKQWLEAFL